MILANLENQLQKLFQEWVLALTIRQIGSQQVTTH